MRSINPSIVIDYFEETIVSSVRFVKTLWIISDKTITFPNNFTKIGQIYYIKSLNELEEIINESKQN